MRRRAESFRSSSPPDFYSEQPSSVLRTRRNLSIPILAFAILLVSPLLSHAWQGKVEAVHDGDTISVMRDGDLVKVRLAGIDCPERAQPYGKRAKQFTSDLVQGKEVQVRVETTDRYGRIVGWVTLPDGTNLNREILRVGMAWPQLP